MDNQNAHLAIGEHSFSIPPRTASLLYVTQNEPALFKTGLSINVSIRDTCQPEVKQLLGSEPSTIYTQLPIRLPTPHSIPPQIGYFPTYHGLTPEQKGHYLTWLQDVRAPILISYVFIYYYGLERRLITDAFDAAFEEIRLLQAYHPHPSFLGYSMTALFHAVWIQKLPESINRLFPLNWNAPDIGLLLAYVTQQPLTSHDLISLSKYISGIERQYLNSKPDKLSSAIDQILQIKFGQPSLPLWRLYDLQSIVSENRQAFANTSLPAHIRMRPAPGIMHHPAFVSDIEKLFNEAHQYIRRTPPSISTQSFSSQNVAELINAARHGSVDAVIVELNRGQDIDGKDRSNKTALMWAAQNGHAQVVKTLLKGDANVNLVDRYTQTALTCAIKESATYFAKIPTYVQIVRMLSDNGAELECQDAQGRTALHLAAKTSTYEIIELLVRQGANLNAKDTAGTTAMEYALERGYTEAIQVLTKADAPMPAPEVLCLDLASTNEAIAWRATCILSHMGDIAITPLLRCWQSNNAQARTNAAKALLTIGDIHAIDVYLEALNSSEPHAQQRAATLLGSSNDSRVFEPFLNLLASEDAYLRQCAAEAMIRVGDARAVPALCTVLEDTSNPNGIRSYALQALTRIGDQRAVPSICSALDDDDLRQYAAEALGILGDARATIPLLRVFDQNELFAQASARESLLKIGKKAIPLLEAEIASRTKRNTLHAQSILKQLQKQYKLTNEPQKDVAHAHSSSRTMTLLVPDEGIEISDPSMGNIEMAVRKSFSGNGFATVLVVDDEKNLFIQNESGHIEYNEFNGGTIYAIDDIDVETAVKTYFAYAQGETAWKVSLPWLAYLTQY